MPTSRENPKLQWQGKTIVAADHVPELEHEAALHEFGEKLPRQDSEALAHSDYKKKHHQEAAAHHLRGMKASHALGQVDEGRKHAALYALHMQALGHSPYEEPPDSIANRAHEEGEKKLYRYHPHAADSLVTTDEDLKKSLDVDLDMVVMAHTHLAKSRAVPTFPKLGMPDNRAETQYQSTPRQSRIAVRGRANSIRQMSKDPVEAERAFGVPAEDMRDIATSMPADAAEYPQMESMLSHSTGSVGVGPNPHPFVSDARGQAKRYMGMTTEAQDLNNSMLDPHSPWAVKQHEDLHGLLHRVGQRFGDEARRNLVSNLMGWVAYRAPEAARTLKNVGQYVYPLDQANRPEEEVLATNMNLLNSASHRKDMQDILAHHLVPVAGDLPERQVVRPPRHTEAREGNVRANPIDPRALSPAQKVISHLKTAHRHMLEGAKMADTRWLEQPGFQRFLAEHHADPSVPVEMKRRTDLEPLDFLHPRVAEARAAEPPKRVKNFLDDDHQPPAVAKAEIKDPAEGHATYPVTPEEKAVHMDALMDTGLKDPKEGAAALGEMKDGDDLPWHPEQGDNIETAVDANERKLWDTGELRGPEFDERGNPLPWGEMEHGIRHRDVRAPVANSYSGFGGPKVPAAGPTLRSENFWRHLGMLVGLDQVKKHERLSDSTRAELVKTVKAMPMLAKARLFEKMERAGLIKVEKAWPKDEAENQANEQGFLSNPVARDQVLEGTGAQETERPAGPSWGRGERNAEDMWNRIDTFGAADGERPLTTIEGHNELTNEGLGTNALDENNPNGMWGGLDSMTNKPRFKHGDRVVYNHPENDTEGNPYPWVGIVRREPGHRGNAAQWYGHGAGEGPTDEHGFHYNVHWQIPDRQNPKKFSEGESFMHENDILPADKHPIRKGGGGEDDDVWAQLEKAWPKSPEENQANEHGFLNNPVARDQFIEGTGAQETPPPESASKEAVMGMEDTLYSDNSGRQIWGLPLVNQIERHNTDSGENLGYGTELDDPYPEDDQKNMWAQLDSMTNEPRFQPGQRVSYESKFMGHGPWTGTLHQGTGAHWSPGRGEDIGQRGSPGYTHYIHWDPNQGHPIPDQERLSLVHENDLQPLADQTPLADKVTKTVRSTTHE